MWKEQGDAVALCRLAKTPTWGDCVRLWVPLKGSVRTVRAEGAIWPGEE